MTSRFDDLWISAADDGASCLAGVVMSRPPGEDEMDQLLDAWYRERTDRIECSLALEEALRWIACLLDEGEVTPRRRRQADRLIRAVRDLRKGEDDTPHA
jgi:hypothetical protein